MPHSENYKVPKDINCVHARELQGIVICYSDGDVVDLQKILIESYNDLSTLYNQYQEVDSWLKGVGDRANTDSKEALRCRWRDEMRTIRNDTVKLMSQILEAGAEPLPPDSALDKDLAAALGTNTLLDAAVAASGGQQAVDDFRIHAARSMDETITRAYPELIEKVQEHLVELQGRATQRAEQAQAAVKAEEHQVLEQQAEATEQQAEATEPAEQAQVNAQGPSAAVVHRHKEMRLKEKLRHQKALDKLKAVKERRHRSPPPRG